MPPKIAPTDPAYVKAMSHPVRVRIMGMLRERMASPAELSGWLGTSLGSTSYHVRVLHGIGLIDLVHERPVRGAVEHFYKANPRALGAWPASRVDPAAKQATVNSQLQILEAHLSASAAAGGFDRPDAVIERKTARLDAKGWRALSRETVKLRERLERIESDAATRIARAGEDSDAIEAGVVLLVFETAELGAQIPTKEPKVLNRARRKSS